MSDDRANPTCVHCGTHVAVTTVNGDRALRCPKCRRTTP